jgi:hypothetical protein
MRHPGRCNETITHAILSQRTIRARATQQSPRSSYTPNQQELSLPGLSFKFRFNAIFSYYQPNRVPSTNKLPKKVGSKLFFLRCGPTPLQLRCWGGCLCEKARDKSCKKEKWRGRISQVEVKPRRLKQHNLVETLFVVIAIYLSYGTKGSGSNKGNKL